jgi:hypothetical protein
VGRTRTAYLRGCCSWRGSLDRIAFLFTPRSYLQELRAPFLCRHLPRSCLHGSAASDLPWCLAVEWRWHGGVCVEDVVGRFSLRLLDFFIGAGFGEAGLIAVEEVEDGGAYGISGAFFIASSGKSVVTASVSEPSPRGISEVPAGGVKGPLLVFFGVVQEWTAVLNHFEEDGTVYCDVPAEAVETGKRLIAAGGLDVAGIEYPEMNGRRIFIRR